MSDNFVQKMGTIDNCVSAIQFWTNQASLVTNYSQAAFLEHPQLEPDINNWQTTGKKNAC